MSNVIPQSHLDLITGPVFAVLSTVSPKGRPENTVVWCSWDGQHVLVNTVAGRRKHNNVIHNPYVALTAIDPNDPYRWIDVRAYVEEIVPDAGYANINAHSLLYDGNPEYYGGRAPLSRKDTEERLVMKLRPVRVLIYPHPK